MNLTLENRRLWWKETRQMYPLVLMLLALVPLMLLVNFASEQMLSQGNLNIERKEWTLFLVLGLPGIFAVGAGILLVGQEKELRTIDWLSSLPIAPARLINIKFHSALLAVGLIWLICLPIALMTMPTSQSNSESALVFQILFWMTYSLFLLTWSFAISWRINGVFAALMTLVPIAILPICLVFTIEFAIEKWNQPSDLPLDQIAILILILLTLIGWFLLQRFGAAALTPEKTLLASESFQSDSRTFGNYRSHAELAGYYRPLKPWSALCWQAFAQYRWLYVFLLGLLLVAGLWQIGKLTLGSDQRRNPLDVLYFESTALYLLAASWLGVLAFQGDSHLKRILFLSDRGVSPAMVWSTRHGSGVFIILIFLLLFSGLLWIFDGYGSRFYFSIILVATVGVLLLVSYIIAQWISQILHGPVISAVVVPILTSVMVMTGFFYLTFVGSPFWLVVLAGLIPLVASWIGKRIWMEQWSSRWGWRWWCGQGLALFLMLAIPVIPGLLAIQRTSGMSIELDRQLRGIAGHSGANWPQTKVSHEIKVEAGLFKVIHEENRRLADYLSFDGTSVQKLIQMVNLVASNTELLRLRWNEKKPAPDALLHYQNSIGLIHKAVGVKSRYNCLLHRDFADQLEIFLLGELKAPDAKERIGDELFEKIVETLGDRKGRNQARRMALANSYVDSQEPGNPLNQSQYLGGYFQYFVETQPSWINLQIRARRAGSLIEDLSRLLDSTPGSVDRELIERIAKDWRGSADQYQSLSPNIQSDIVSDNQSFDLDVFRLRLNWNQNAPGLLWHGSWENEGEELLKNYRKSKQSNPVSD